ncbi:MAG TPA: dihydrolipoamide acetyltransferase family protein [Steroidobacteraceae bacterium]|jgi:pyruvate dehydrogenase E2 component (dihydrolipoamide acetyltransferase)|nr:dihydrolipoamide acetyltransferase family protein [Steroidobacteraceae bacterium]
MTVFKLPDLGEGLSEAEIVRWHIQPGDHIAVDAPMLSVETAKAVVEVPSPVSGTVVALHAQPGDRIEIGAPLVEFRPDVEANEAGTHAAGAAAADHTGNADAGTVVGQMPADAAEAAAAAALEAANAVIATAPRVRAVPAARALARSLGVSLTSVQGSGRGGLITLDDVMALGLPDRRASSTLHPGPAARPVRPPANEPADVEVLRSLRRAMAQSMAISRDSVMDCSVFDDADLAHWKPGNNYTTRVLRAIAAGARAEPGLNAWYDAESQSRTLFEHVHVGIAVDTADGLLVPVIRHVEQLDDAALRSELDRLKRAARERTVRSEELRHFTFMLSNFGMMAGRYATPVVVPPAVAILGTGRAREDVIAVDGKVAIHPRMPLSLTFDHRVVTGGEAVRFLGALIADLERAE